MTKKEIRQYFKAQRMAIDGRDRLKMDDLLLLQFQQLDFTDIQKVMSYWPLTHLGEPNTLLFTRYLSHLLPDLDLAYPVTDFATHILTAVRITEDTIYQTKELGLTEPKAGDIIEPEELEVILVPMLCCDLDGYRVGYGKGFYDRYLSRCNPNVIRIGFSYFDPIEKITDRDQYDVPLTHCVTPDRIYEF